MQQLSGRRDLAAVLVIALSLGVCLALPQFDGLRGLSVDVLTWLRWRTVGQLHAPQNSPAVVIALDEETYRRKPFAGTPNVTWTREIAAVLDAVMQGGAKVIGLDIIFSTSIEQSEVPFEDGTLGGRVRGFDRDFLRVLAKGARAGKIVLGRVQHQDHPIQPSPGQRIAVGQQDNIRALNFHVDADEVIRRMPLGFMTDGVMTPSMAVELAARALEVKPWFEPDANLMLGAQEITASIPNTIALNFEGGADDIPTYSLADLRECAARGDAAFFQRAFSGRAVLLGAVLDLEDRAVTSKRLATGLPTAAPDRCVLPMPDVGQRFARASISGVYVHATAVNNLIRRDALREPARWQSAIGATALALATSGAALMASPPLALVAFAGVAVAWSAAAIAAFTASILLPFLDALAAGLLALAITVGHRFIVADKDKRVLRRNFALYLPPTVIDKMLASNKPPALGGETRSVTIFFSDLVGFSAFSERLSPAELVSLINTYLTAMTDVIEAHGGFVDKYIGDGIVAVFGAPLDDPDHAEHAVHAALACQQALQRLNQDLPFELWQRIGLNSGEVLVGNLGSRRRFNYTVMGDAVNLASRLEGANRFYGTGIIASEHTASAANGIVWRELDTVRVVGRAAPVIIFEPMVAADLASDDLAKDARLYAEALARWRAGDFKGVCSVLGASSDDDGPAQRLRQRAQDHLNAPPPTGWDAVTTLDGK